MTARIAVGAVALLLGGALFATNSVPAPAEPTSAQLESEVAARAVVERAVVTGQWGDEELSRFREQFSLLTRAQQGNVLQSVSLAINQGRFRPDRSRLPL